MTFSTEAWFLILVVIILSSLGNENQGPLQNLKTTKMVITKMVGITGPLVMSRFGQLFRSTPIKMSEMF